MLHTVSSWFHVPSNVIWTNDQQMSVLPNELLKGTLRDQVFDEAFGHNDSIHSRGFVTPSLRSSILSLTCGFVTDQFNLVILMPRCWVNLDSQRLQLPGCWLFLNLGTIFFFITLNDIKFKVGFRLEQYANKTLSMENEFKHVFLHRTFTV